MKNVTAVLTISDFNPLRDMSVATYLQEELVKTTYPYILSSTSVSQNNTILPYKLFTNALRAFASTGVIFLETPVVNNVDLNDQRALKQLMEQQISLLVDRHVYPVGISAPGYWNQDLQYQEDGLAISDTVILRENPPIERVFIGTKRENQSLIRMLCLIYRMIIYRGLNGRIKIIRMTIDFQCRPPLVFHFQILKRSGSSNSRSQGSTNSV